MNNNFSTISKNYNEIHYKLIDFFSKEQQNMSLYSSPIRNFMNEYSELNNDEVSVAIKELIADKLLLDGTYHATMTQQGANLKRTTEQGDEFLAWHKKNMLA